MSELNKVKWSDLSYEQIQNFVNCTIVYFPKIGRKKINFP